MKFKGRQHLKAIQRELWNQIMFDEIYAIL